MSSQTFTNCDAGTWYAFNKTEVNIGQTVQVQFGAFDDTTDLNIYLTRPGGSLVQSLVCKSKGNVTMMTGRKYSHMIVPSKCWFQPKQQCISPLQFLINM